MQNYTKKALLSLLLCFVPSFFKEKLPEPKELAELLTMHSFEVEEVEKEKNDWLLDIDVLPNRGPDCFSHLGVAREISAILNLKLEIKDYNIKEEKHKAKDFVALSVKNSKDCLRYTARVIVNVKVAPSPKWIRDRLKLLGLKPINNIVDMANYAMIETGQPLHAFDLDKVVDQKIIVRKAKKGEKIVTLDNERYELDEWIVMPNHVHVLVKPLGNHQISNILHSWKSFSAKNLHRKRNNPV